MNPRSTRSNYEALVRLVLREIRQSSTQKLMSEKMGFKFNQWHKWESGQKALKWKDFKKIADEFDLVLDQLMVSITSSDYSIRSGGEFVKLFMQKYSGSYSDQAVLEKLKISKATLNRIISSKNDVEVAFVFQCLGEFSSTLPYFIYSLVRTIKDQSVVSSINQSLTQVNLEGDHPWLSTIEAYLETTQYQNSQTHSNKDIAKHLGLNIADVELGLQLLLNNNAIFKDGGKYKLNIKRVDLETNIIDSARFAKFWTNICLKRYSTFDGVPPSRKGWSSRVFPVSNKADDEIRALMKKMESEMARILQADEKLAKDKVRVFILHYFDQEELQELKL